MEEPISVVLKRAKDVLLERGWYQGDYANPITGEVCIMGAVNVAETGDAFYRDEDDDDIETALELFLHNLAVRCWFRDIAAWNDARERTPEAVLAFMDHAIALAEARESARTDPAVGRPSEQPHLTTRA